MRWRRHRRRYGHRRGHHDFGGPGFSFWAGRGRWRNGRSRWCFRRGRRRLRRSRWCLGRCRRRLRCRWGRRGLSAAGSSGGLRRGGWRCLGHLGRFRSARPLRPAAFEYHVHGRRRWQLLRFRRPFETQHQRQQHHDVEQRGSGEPAGDPAPISAAGIPSRTVPWGQGRIPVAMMHAIGSANSAPSRHGSAASWSAATIAGMAASG